MDMTCIFGEAGSNNDINVLARSPLFDEVLEVRAPETKSMFSGKNYNLGYFLADEVYPKRATFVKTVPRP